MASFKVVSDNFAHGKQGATVNESELDGLNLAALVEAGVLEPVGSKTVKTTNNTEGE